MARMVLGIDPGVDITGYAVITDDGNNPELLEFGVIRTDRQDTHANRLVTLQHDLTSILERFPDIAIAGVERLFFGNNVTTAIPVAEARGVALFTIADKGITIEEVTPPEVKSAVASAGNAQKHEVQRMVQLIFGLEEIPRPDDAADAVAVALTVSRR